MAMLTPGMIQKMLQGLGTQAPPRPQQGDPALLTPTAGNPMLQNGFGGPPQGQTGTNAFSPSYTQDPTTGQYGYNGASGNPALAYGAAQGNFTTPQAAEAAWFKGNPQYAQNNTGTGALGMNNGAGANAPAGGAGAPPGADNGLMQALIQPGYLGAPTQVDPTTFAGTTNAPVAQYGGAQVGPASQAQAASAGPAAMFGGAQLGSAATMGAASTGAASSSAATLGPAAQATGANMGFGNVDPALLAALGPQAAIQQIQAGFAPEFQRQDRGLQQALAEAGVVGGAGVNAETNLSNNQTAAMAPALAGAIQNAQGNQLSAAGQGSNLFQQTGQFNTAATNSNQQLGAQFQEQTGIANQQAQNAAAQMNAQLQEQASAANMQAQNQFAMEQGQLNQQAGLANMGAYNQQSQFNAGNQQQTNAQNAGANNAMQQFAATLAQQTGLSNADALNQARTLFSQQQQQTGLFNAGAANDASRLNAGSTNSVDAYNNGLFNTGNQNMLSQVMQAYYNQQNAKQGAILGGQQAQNGLASQGSQQFQIPTGASQGFNGLAGALGGIYGAKPPAGTGLPNNSAGNNYNTPAFGT